MVKMVVQNYGCYVINKHSKRASKNKRQAESGARRQEQATRHPRSCILHPADVARYLTLPCAGKLNFVISQYHWFPGYETSLQDGVEVVAALCKNLASVCGSLVWKNCTFRDYTVVSILPIRKGSIKAASATLQADLWGMLDDSVPEIDMEEMSQRLAKGIFITDAERVFEEFQTPYPSLAAQPTLYRGDELTGLAELDARRLTRLTLWALSDDIVLTPPGSADPSDEFSEDEPDEGSSTIFDSSTKGNGSRHSVPADGETSNKK